MVGKHVQSSIVPQTVFPTSIFSSSKRILKITKLNALHYSDNNPPKSKKKKLSVQRCASCISSVPHLLPLRKSLILSVSSCQVFKEEIQFQLPFMLWLFWCNNSGSPSLLGALSLPTETFPRFTFSWRPQPTHNMIRSVEYLEKFLKREERELAQEIVWKGEYLEGRLLPNSCPSCWVFGLNKDGFSVCCSWHVLKDGQTHGRKQMLPT